MLDSLFRALCRPNDAPMELEPGAVVAIWALLALGMALPAAGKFGAGGVGAFGLALLVFGGLLMCWFWSGAALTLLARLAGGRGTVESTLGALAQAAWPLLLMPPALALANAPWFPAGDALVAAVLVWALVLGVVFLRRVHALTWARAVMAWVTLAAASVLTGVLGVLASGVFAILLL
jgi:hypothetical protein